MTAKGQDLITTVTQTFFSVEQRLLHFTYACIGASIGFLQGSFHGAQRLQPHFASTDGFKELVCGSEHPERKSQSVSDLLKSWIPNFSSQKQDVKTIGGPQYSYSKTNGATVTGTKTDVQTDPMAAPPTPAKFTPDKMTNVFTTGRYTTDEGEGHAPANGVHGDSAMATREHSFVSEGQHSTDADDGEDDDEGDAGPHDDPNHHRRRKKAKAAIKKVGHKIKKVFEPIVIASDKEHGGMIGKSCMHPATK